jgi:ribosomal protein S18 acetylase RimI-like enzyme
MVNGIDRSFPRDASARYAGVMTISVRAARPDEYAVAGTVTADAYREFLEGSKWAAYIRDIADVEDRAERTEILVAVDDGRIIGSATLELDARASLDDAPLAPHEAHIRMLGVHPDARGRGAAKALMAGCEARAREAGKTVLTLNTIELMAAAKAMYEDLGYARLEDEPQSDGIVLLSYEKQL